MAVMEETRYRDLFERHLNRVVEAIVAASQGGADEFREELFGTFLENHMFVCGTCASEFAAAGTTEDEAVLCSECRR